LCFHQLIKFMKSFKIVISPSKSLSNIKNENCRTFSQPRFIEKSVSLVNLLKKISPKDLGLLMGISPKLAELNWVRYQKWTVPFSVENSRQAILTFSGDVYEGLNANDFGETDFDYSQHHLRILSGLYGLLSPLDLIQPYRLEMGSSLLSAKNQTLYDYWSKLITESLNSELKQGEILVNLASNEYFKAIDQKRLKAKILNIEFRESKPDGLKVVAILSKRARGLMARYSIKNKISNVENLKLFDSEGYMFNEPLSSDSKWVFIR